MTPYQLKNFQSRAACAENLLGQRGAGGTAGNGRKGAPCVWPFPAGTTHTLLDTDGPGRVRHIWITVPPGNPLYMRNLILRMYWDHSPHPSVEAPLGDFFGIAHGRQREFVTDYVYMQSGKGLNCWIPMPFAKHARITLENDTGGDVPMLFYQVDYTLGDEVGADAGYFHAQFRRLNPCPLGEDFELLSTRGRGVWLGAVIGVRTLFRDAWWGEGEVKFYMDGDTRLPTICGTGTEDYMGSAWGLDAVATPHQGAPLVDNENGLYSLYRFHGRDPVYFQSDLRVTIQQIGYGNREKARVFYGEKFSEWRAAGSEENSPSCYFERHDDWCSVAYWYQLPQAQQFPVLPDRAARSADLQPDAKALGRSDV
jgi:hypothetical protein